MSLPKTYLDKIKSMTKDELVQALITEAELRQSSQLVVNKMEKTVKQIKELLKSE